MKGRMMMGGKIAIISNIIMGSFLLASSVLMAGASPTERERAKEKLTITLINWLEPEIYVEIKQIIPGQDPRDWPLIWQGPLDSQYAFDPRQVQLQDRAQVTLPIDALRMRIARDDIKVYYINFTSDELIELRNSGATSLRLNQLFSYPFRFYRFTGWRPTTVDPRRVERVWEKMGRTSESEDNVHIFFVDEVD